MSKAIILIQRLRKEIQRLRDLCKKLKHINKKRDDFILMSSHDLKTPLIIIRGYSELLLSEKFGSLNEEQSKFIRHIQDHAQKLLFQMRDMIHFYEEEAKHRFRWERVSLRKYFKQLFDKFVVEEQRRDIVFRYSFDKYLPKYAVINCKNVDFVVHNLLLNAFRFTPPNGEVLIGVKKQSKYLQIEVSDTGIGMVRSYQKKFLERFERIKNESVEKISDENGVGLSLVKKILEEMKGRIMIKRHQKSGTLFQVQLPVQQFQ